MVDETLGLTRERRLTEQLILYWNEKRGERKYPSMKDIQESEIGHIWQDCFFVAVREVAESPEHQYIYIGENIKQMFGGQLASTSVLPLADTLASQYYMVMQAKKPLIQETQFTNLDDEIIRYRQILLPLGPNDEVVDHVLGGLRSNLTHNKD